MVWAQQRVMVVVRVWAQKGRGHGCGVVVPQQKVRGLSFVALPAAQEAAVVEHVLRHGVQSPVVAFAGVPRLARNLDEAVVEGEVVPDGVLPCGELLTIVREPRHDELADAT